MKRVKLEKLNDIISTNTDDLSSFIGFDVIRNTDINNVEYELKGDEDKYHFLCKFGDNAVFVSESHLLQTLLGEYIDDIESGDIYSHGYPESRLIPSDHNERCQESCLEQILVDITEKVSDIIEQYFN